MKFMTMSRSAENAGSPPPALVEAMGDLVGEAFNAGVLVDAGGLLPSRAGAVMRLEGGKVTVTDGPFAEAREVVGGYAVFDVPSRTDVLDWARRFLELHQRHWPGWEGESEIRLMEEAPPAVG
jgi:hypothetical protein